MTTARLFPTRRRTRGAPIIAIIPVIAALAAGAVLGALGGCTGALSSTGSSAPPPSVLSGSATGARGVESWVFVVDDTDDQAGRVLASVIERPPEGRASASEVLQNNGLRVVSVPIAQIDRFIAGLSETGRRRQEWLGEPLSWTPVVGSDPFPRATLGTDAGVTDLPAGAMVLYARAWAVRRSDASPGAGPLAMRLELVPAFEGANRATLWFRRLFAEMELGRGEALVLIAAHPLTDWWDLPPPDPARTGPMRSVDTGAIRRAMGYGLNDTIGPDPDEAEGSGSASSPRRSPDPDPWTEPGATGASPAPVGPGLPRLASVGELLLGSRVSGASSDRSAAVVILIPRLDGRVGRE